MYQQGYRPEPFSKKRQPVGSQAGYAPQQSSGGTRQPRTQRRQATGNAVNQAPTSPPMQNNRQAQASQPMPNGFQPQGIPLAQNAWQPLPNQSTMANGYRPQTNQPVQRRQKVAAKPHSKAPKPKGKVPWLLICFCILLVAGLIVGGNHWQISAQVTPYDNTFAHGVYIDDIDMGGLTFQEGASIIYTRVEEKQNSWFVDLTYAGQLVERMTCQTLNMSFNPEEILTYAFSLAKDGDIYQRKAAQDRLQQEPYKAYTGIPSADTTVIDQMLAQLKQSIYKAPQDAVLLGFDANASEPFTYQEEVIGRELDIADIKEQLYYKVEHMETGELEIVPTPLYPAVTVAQLQQKTALRSEWVTDIDKHSTENRTNNIRVAFGYLSGTILQPDKRFSFNSTVKTRTEKNGYFEAIEYAYGTEQMGIGGGVCQASTTVYLAALTAGLEILERKPHSAPVSYAKFGLDATVNSEKNHEIDLVFKNNTDSPIYITAAVQSKTGNSKSLVCRVRVYGESLGNVKYQTETSTIEILKPPSEIIYVKDRERLYCTYTDEKKKIYGPRDGAVVETYLCTIQDNIEVSRKKISTDTYPYRQERWWIGPYTR